jgi:uncharacterized membrane protein YczE
MHAPPKLRGGLRARLTWLVLGLFLCACGIVAFLESGLGLPPWDVLHQGLSEQLGVSFGVANLIVSLAVLVLVWALRAHIGIGTVLNAALTGTFVILLLAVDAVAAHSEEPLAARIGLVVLGLALLGAGTGVYIAASLGAGPRDSLMLVTARGLGVRIGAARTGVEVAALALGFALGGTAGIGTLVFAVGIGPVVEASFWLLGRTPLAVPAVASSAA